MTASPNVLLRLANKAENVALVRETLSGVADAAALDRTQLDDVRTAVSEACNNVVLHAYDGSTGPLEVDIVLLTQGLAVLVRDHGGGIRPRPMEEGRIPGIGLAVINALSDRVEFSGVNGSGTEVAMTFGTGDARIAAGVQVTQPEAEGDVVVSVTPASLAPSIFSRLAGALSARARFSIDRLSDAQLVTDAIAGASDPVTLALESGERRLDLRLGPLAAGHGERLLGHPSIRPLIEKLTDEARTEPAKAGEIVHLALRDSR
ncbi:MAG: hypothetical protein NVSMB51_03700 [Solirubrobacteraceae bacterium]